MLQKQVESVTMQLAQGSCTTRGTGLKLLMQRQVLSSVSCTDL